MKILSLLPIFLIFFFSCGKPEDNTPPADCSKVNATYSEIKKITAASCNSSSCHGQGSGNGDFTTHAGIKAKAENGTLKNRVVVKKDMPPGKRLTTEQIHQIECWINNGAPEN
jgi:mono/diheme cytochrome c family protein